MQLLQRFCHTTRRITIHTQIVMSQNDNPLPNKLYLTNNYSIVSKYSASKAGYFKDELLEEFIEQSSTSEIDSRRRRTPLVNRGYAARSIAVEWAVSRAIKYENIHCFIILGSGYDLLAQRHLNECHWIEVDLPRVIGTKSKFIETQWDLDSDKIQRSNDGNVIHYPDLCLTLIGCDLLRSQNLIKFLTDAMKPMRHECRNVAILNEVCLCYSDRSQVMMILSSIGKVVQSFCWRLHYIGYEQVQFGGDDNFASFMKYHFETLGHPLKLFPTITNLNDLLTKELNFDHATISPMFQIYHNALYYLTQAADINKLEPFDEYEEMDLYLSHYALVTAVLIIKSPFPVETDRLNQTVLRGEIGESLDQCDIASNTNLYLCPIRRIGHSMATLEELGSSHAVLLSGGFGCNTLDDSKHRRLADCLILNKDESDTGEWEAKTLDTSNLTSKHKLRLDRMHGKICPLGTSRFFFQGGRQSPSESSSVASNAPFICQLDNEQKSLHLEYVFDSETPSQRSKFIRWRQGLTKLSNSKILQCGGLGPVKKSQDLVVLYDFEGDKTYNSSWCGDELCSERWISCFSRHSFASDSRDCHSFALFGGLQANHDNRDRPIENEYSFILCDLRTKPTGEAAPFVLAARSAHFYGAQMHFIDSNRFAVVGGVCSLTGKPNNLINIYDLRHKMDHPVSGQSLQPVGECSSLLIWTNFASAHWESLKEIGLFGGGGNYFTFGTHFNDFQLAYEYTKA